MFCLKGSGAVFGRTAKRLLRANFRWNPDDNGEDDDDDDINDNYNGDLRVSQIRVEHFDLCSWTDDDVIESVELDLVNAVYARWKRDSGEVPAPPTRSSTWPVVESWDPPRLSEVARLVTENMTVAPDVLFEVVHSFFYLDYRPQSPGMDFGVPLWPVFKSVHYPNREKNWALYRTVEEAEAVLLPMVADIPEFFGEGSYCSDQYELLCAEDWATEPCECADCKNARDADASSEDSDEPDSDDASQNASKADDAAAADASVPDSDGASHGASEASSPASVESLNTRVRNLLNREPGAADAFCWYDGTLGKFERVDGLLRWTSFPYTPMVGLGMDSYGGGVFLQKMTVRVVARPLSESG